MRKVNYCEHRVSHRLHSRPLSTCPRRGSFRLCHVSLCDGCMVNHSAVMYHCSNHCFGLSVLTLAYFSHPCNLLLHSVKEPKAVTA